MSPEELAKILDSSEGSTLEFKNSLNFKDKIARTICAFANSSGGLLIIGVEKHDKKTTINGVPNSDLEFQKLVEIISKLRPKPYYNTTASVHSKKTLILISVQPLPSSEICFLDKLAYRRVGSINEEISGQNLVHFLQQRGTISFEENRSSAAISDLDEGKIRKLLKQMNNRIEEHEPLTLPSVLGSIGVANVLGEFFLKNSAILFFARNVQQFFMNSEVRIVKFRGKQKSLEALEYDQRFIDTLPELLETIFSTVKEKAGMFSRLESTKRVERPMIPDEVLREALTNAVGHRDYFDPNGILIELYDDRIEITNPGSLLPGLTLKNFIEIRKARNPVVYRLLNDSQWGEGLNLGIKSMYRLMRQNKLPDPEFEELGGVFRVTLHGPLSDRKIRPYGLISERQQKAVEYLKKNPHISAPKFAKLCSISHPTAIRDLNELVAQGLIIKVGRQRSSKYLMEKH